MRTAAIIGTDAAGKGLLVASGPFSVVRTQWQGYTVCPPEFAKVELLEPSKRLVNENPPKPSPKVTK